MRVLNDYVLLKLNKVSEHTTESGIILHKQLDSKEEGFVVGFGPLVPVGELAIEDRVVFNATKQHQIVKLDSVDHVCIKFEDVMFVK
jgi:co-chaperonin GroES (HSP10)